MSDARYLSVGAPVQLFAGVSALAPPASDTDANGGFDVAPLLTARRGFPALVALLLAASNATTITNVELYAFELGRWSLLSVPPAGSVIYPSLALSTIPTKFLIENIGNPTRIAPVAVIPGPATVAGWIQRIERK